MSRPADPPTDPRARALLLRIGGRLALGLGIATQRKAEGLCVKCGLVKAGPPVYTCEPCLGDVGHAAVDVVVDAIFGRKPGR